MFAFCAMSAGPLGVGAPTRQEKRSRVPGAWRTATAATSAITGAAQARDRAAPGAGPGVEGRFIILRGLTAAEATVFQKALVG